MKKGGVILVEGVVQGVGFRPFVYSSAMKFRMTGSVRNLGGTVEIIAFGNRFSEFLEEIKRGPPLARIDRITVQEIEGTSPASFTIEHSEKGVISGMIPPDVAICDSCLSDISDPGGRYEGYWATSCVNCGPRYSIIRGIPYDRERTSMSHFVMCGGCGVEYQDPCSRRHHAQTIACADCGPALSLLDARGNPVICGDVIGKAAELLDSGSLVAIRGIGGFHLCCTEEGAPELKRRLGRTEQAFAVLVRPDAIDGIADISPDERKDLTGPERPIVVLDKRDPDAHRAISNLHTIGCMLPYTGFHHLLFTHLKAPFIVMTSANVPGDPMITSIDKAMERLSGSIDFFLTHNRPIINRCDDSVVRNGFIIRLSRGYAPKRTRINLGNRCILGVGPELNANITIYRDGFTTTSPHIGNVRNPATFGYLKETIHTFTEIMGAEYDIIAHDLHPQFLSTRYARDLARDHGAVLVPVQHHKAHVAAVTREPCIGIAIDGVGYGDDGSVWGGEVFAGQVPDLVRVAHLEPVPMPGGDLATRYPERMLYGFLPDDLTRDLLMERGWTDLAIGAMDRQITRTINTVMTSSTGRALDAASALLGICTEKTYDGEPAMKLESAAAAGRCEAWEVPVHCTSGSTVLMTRELMRQARERYLVAAGDIRASCDIAASFQYNLARGIARLAVDAAGTAGLDTVAVSGGVAINRAIRHTIQDEIRGAGLICLFNREYPLGDGCISFGQSITASFYD
jgi:hydrogenase maturation protein HypF